MPHGQYELSEKTTICRKGKISTGLMDPTRENIQHGQISTPKTDDEEERVFQLARGILLMSFSVDVHKD